MTVRRDRPVYLAIFLLVLAPLGAAVIVAALLLFGVEPRLVFLTGFTLIAWLKRMGLHAPNAVGVLTTVFVWWVVIVVVAFAGSAIVRRR